MYHSQIIHPSDLHSQIPDPSIIPYIDQSFLQKVHPTFSSTIHVQSNLNKLYTTLDVLDCAEFLLTETTVFNFQYFYCQKCLQTSLSRIICTFC